MELCLNLGLLENVFILDCSESPEQISSMTARKENSSSVKKETEHIKLTLFKNVKE